MNNDIQIFNYNDREVRTVQKDGGPWFVLKDVCEVLGLGSPHKVADRLEPDEKGRNQIPTLGGNQETWVINESGLYAVILRSDKPEAKPFRKWVTSEVLPSIRKNGGYIAGQESMTPAELMASALLMAQKTLAEREARIADLTVQNQIMQPKAEYFDELCDRETLTGIYETAKELGVAPRKFTADLVKHRYLYRGKKGQLLPYESKNDGLFVLKETFNNQTKWSGTQTLITVKGRELFRMMRLGA